MNKIFSLENPPSAPKKKAKESFQLPLEWRDRARRNLVHEFVETERRACLREVEELIELRRQRETEERFLWLRSDFVEKDLDGPFFLEDGTKFYL